MNILEQSQSSHISLEAIEVMAQAEAENSDCPNGCIDQLGSGCEWYDWHQYYREASWN